MPSQIYIHETAIVNSPEKIGEGTKIWHFTHVRNGAEIGANCVLGQNVYIAESVRIGAGCRIQNNVSIYDGVLLADDVFVGPSVVFTNVKRPRADLRQNELFSQTKIEKGVTLGANATIVCGITIGEYAFVGAGAVVTKSLPPYVMAVGVPAKIIGFVCRCGQDLPDDFGCEKCGTNHKDVSR